MTTLLRVTERGLYCDAGGFHVDPWRPVERAVLTHAHGDHARPGSASYLCTREGEGVTRARLGTDARIRAVEYGEAVEVEGVRVSLHPAGHVLGSAQVRVEHRGEVWVVSGDYKTDADPTCTPFEPVRCHTFVTESTFGLPVYRWPPAAEVFASIDAWWRRNRDEGRTSILFAYALGKAQRLLAGVDATIGPVLVHGAVERLNDAYHAAGVALPRAENPVRGGPGAGGALVVAPPSAHGTPWMRRFGAASTAVASGWMRVRGQRRRRGVDRGFVLSDHVDWPSLLAAIEATGAGRVWVTHGRREPVVRWLREHGLEATAVSSRWEGDEALAEAETGGGGPAERDAAGEEP
jgi:putative mRNA 3-end processing factor